MKRARSIGRKRLAEIAGAVGGLTLVLALYSWTAATSSYTFPTELSLNGRDYYNHLVDALLHGRAALLVEPPQALLALQNPYDARQHLPIGPPHDMSLFDGRYYVYWGPTPAVTLFLPARLLLLGHDLSERVALVIFSFAGLLVSLALLRYVVRRFLPDAPRWMLAMGGLALATGTTALYNLRRPTIYEVALSAGFCFTMTAVYLLLRGALEERHRWRRLSAGSACLGLAAGARPNLALTGVLALAVLGWLWRSGVLPSWKVRRRAILALFGPVSVAGLLLLAYNYARFGSPTQFGLIYQLNGFVPFPPEGGFPHFVPGLYYYLLAPPRLTVNFPFVHLPPPPAVFDTLPPRYNLERIGGLLPMVPIVLLLVVALPMTLRSSVPRVRGLGAVMAAGSVVAGIIVVAICASIYAATMRYGMDFYPLVLVAALVAWIFLAGLQQRRLGRLYAVLGAASIVWTAVAGIATSLTGQFESLRFGDKDAYASLERAFEPLPLAVASLRDEAIISELSAPQGADVRARYDDLSAGTIRSVGIGNERTVLEVISPDRRRLRLRADASPNPGLGPAPARLAVSLRGRGVDSVVLRPAGPLKVPMTLEPGRNHIELRVLDPPPVGPPLAGSLLTLSDLRLSE